MEWKPIDNYEDFYEVSSDGRVRTVSRKVQIGNHSRIIPSRELKPQKSKDGYLMVCLCKENRKITKKIAQADFMKDHTFADWLRIFGKSYL